MADSRDLTIILNLKDQVSKQLKGLEGKINDLQPAFKKMAAAGTIAFGAISTFGGFAIKQAAIAEGAYNKFNTVFGKNSDDMLAFVKELRQTMPSATSDIVKMAADLQDLLVPLGLSRDSATELSKGFLEVSNKIAAFNDVEPTEVLEAMKSALAGSSEPLRRFGVNALETSLETRAMQEGLLKAGQSFKDLDPNVKNQIRAQALLAQVIDNSADAINGFADNNDSFIRRQQNLQATLKETQEAIGGPLLKTFDNLLKKVQPVVTQVGDWVEKNPELTEKILLLSAGIAGLVAVIGTLGFVLPAIITGFGLLFSPITLVIAVIAGLVYGVTQLVKHWDVVQEKIYSVWGAVQGFLLGVWQNIKDTSASVWNGIVEYFTGIWDTLKAIFTVSVNFLVGLVVTAFEMLGIDIVGVMTSIGESIQFGLELVQTIWTTIWGVIFDYFTTQFEMWKKMIEFVAPYVSAVWTKAKEIISNVWSSIWESLTSLTNQGIDKLKAPIEAVIQWLQEKIASIKRSLASIGESVGGFLGGVVQKGAAITGLRASGGPVSAGGSYIVGEQGPELFVPRGSGSIVPNGAGGITVNVVVNGDVSGQELVEKVQESMMQSLRMNTKLAL